MPAKRSRSKLYTRSGDRGETGLYGRRRVRKDHPRVVAYGTIDELNSVLGVAASFTRAAKLARTIESIQNELFDIGAELASVEPANTRARSAVPKLTHARVVWLEGLIDEYDAQVPELKNFILPGGSTSAAFLHLARTVARRAERETVTLARTERVNPEVLAYLNRLCDLLFALARYANKSARRREVRWQKRS